MDSDFCAKALIGFQQRDQFTKNLGIIGAVHFVDDKDVIAFFRGIFCAVVHLAEDAFAKFIFHRAFIVVDYPAKYSWL